MKQTMMTLKNRLLPVLFLFLLSFAQSAAAQIGREPEPQLYPNQHLQKVGQAQANRDIAKCKNQAQTYINSQSQSGQTLKKGARNAAKGAALGAMAGAITGNNVGRSAGAGAAVGGTATVLNKAGERGARNPVYQKYASSCLEDLGYKVVEWR